MNGCFCRLGEAGQLFSGDSEKQWTTAVLKANVRFLLLMLAARHHEEDIRRSWSRLKPSFYISEFVNQKLTIKSKIESIQMNTTGEVQQISEFLLQSV